MNRRDLLKSLIAIPILGLLIKQDSSNPFDHHIVNMKYHIGKSLIVREKLFELGQRSPYYRYINFPLKVTQ